MIDTHRILGTLVCICSVVTMVTGLDNGLARTPPMGWLSWERFECNTECETDPDNCIGERLVKMMADVMATEGYRDAGYEYITLDDCWPANQRDSDGKLQPDPKRFPAGMKALADYVHSRGLKLGLYEDVGRHTCAGFPGSQGHIDGDAQTFAEWGVDMIKFDGCNADESYYHYGFPAMATALNKTGRHILYSCEWPLYERSKGVKPNYTAVAETCNTWRVYGDIYDSWQSITSITNWYGNDEGNFSAVAHPGAWNDADMIVIGNFGLSRVQERAQLGLWAMFASPLLLSVDLRTIRRESKALLLNSRVLAVNQDPLGIQATRLLQMDAGNTQVYTRPLASPTGSKAIAVVNMRNHGYPLLVSLSLKTLGLRDERGYNVTELFDGLPLGVFNPTQNMTFTVNPTGIYMIKATPSLKVQRKHEFRISKLKNTPKNSQGL